MTLVILLAIALIVLALLPTRATAIALFAVFVLAHVVDLHWSAVFVLMCLVLGVCALLPRSAR